MFDFMWLILLSCQQLGLQNVPKKNIYFINLYFNNPDHWKHHVIGMEDKRITKKNLTSKGKAIPVTGRGGS
jgi:hypothetical protein